MQSQLINWFVLDTQTKSGTDWVVTMPTKPFYSLTVSGRAGTARPPFKSNFWAGGAPEFFGQYPAYDDLHCRLPPGTPRTMLYDREAMRPNDLTCILPATVPEILLSWTANVLTFKSAFIVGTPSSRIASSPPLQIRHFQPAVCRMDGRG
jgi:hypothetical protein